MYLNLELIFPSSWHQKPHHRNWSSQTQTWLWYSVSAPGSLSAEVSVEVWPVVAVAHHNLLLLLDSPEGPHLVPPAVSHHPAANSVRKAAVIEERDVAVETSLGVVAVQIRVLLRMKILKNLFVSSVMNSFQSSKQGILLIISSTVSVSRVSNISAGSLNLRIVAFVSSSMLGKCLVLNS